MQTLMTQPFILDQAATADLDDPGDCPGGRLLPTTPRAADLALLPDRELVTLAQAGSQPAFEQLVARHQPAVRRFLLRRTQDPELANDLLQETFLDAWQCLEKVHDGSGFARWLYRIARNNLLPEWRRRPCASIDQVIEEDGVIPEALHVADATTPCHERVLIEQAFDCLGESAKSALSSSVQGFSSEELAQQLGIAPEAARKRITRAKQQFRAAYQAA